jgi:hypothetical protein
MELMYFLLFIMVMWCLVLSIAGITTHFTHYSTYRRVYKLLPTYTFKDVGDNMVITNQYPNVKIIWFKDKNDFKLDNDVYLFSNTIFNFDPIHLYWYLKYKQWFKNNIK